MDAESKREPQLPPVQFIALSLRRQRRHASAKRLRDGVAALYHGTRCTDREIAIGAGLRRPQPCVLWDGVIVSPNSRVHQDGAIVGVVMRQVHWTTNLSGVVIVPGVPAAPRLP